MTSEQDPVQGWSLEEGVKYEVAQDVLMRLIAIAGRRIRQLEDQPEPDQAEIAQWQERRSTWIRRRHELLPTDAVANQQVLDEDGQILRALQDAE